MKVMDQRIATVENQVTDLYTAHRAKKEEESFKRSHASLKQNPITYSHSVHKEENFQQINSGSFNPYSEQDIFKHEYQDVYNPPYNHYIPGDEVLDNNNNVVDDYGYNQFYEDTLKLKNYEGTNVFNNNYQDQGYNEEVGENVEHQVVTEKDLEIFEDKNNHIEEIDVPIEEEKDII